MCDGMRCVMGCGVRWDAGLGWGARCDAVGAPGAAARKDPCGAAVIRPPPLRPAAVELRVSPSAAVPEGAAVRLTCAVRGAAGAALSYAWYRDGAPFGSGPDPTVTIRNATAAASGSYHCAVRGPERSRSAAPVALTVLCECAAPCRPGARWGTQGHRGAHRDTVGHGGTQWDTLGYVGTPHRDTMGHRDNMAHGGTQWGTEGHHIGTHRDTMGHGGTQWGTKGHVGTPHRDM